MKPLKDKGEELSELRRRAEEKLRIKEDSISGMPAKDLKYLVHELGVYQIELDMQNEELRRAQVAIEESRLRYVDLYDFAPVGYLTLDGSGRITEMNLTASNMLGKPRETVQGKNFLKNFVYSEDLEKLRAHMAAVRGGDEKAVMELRMMRGDGSRFNAQLKSAAVDGDKGRSINTIVIDITDLKKAEAARKAAEKAEHAARREAEALRVQRLENLRLLSGGIAHDLNNLMVAVQANTELALRELPEGRAREYVEGIDAAVARVSGLARQVLSYTGQGQSVKEPIDLNTCLKETSKLLLASLPKRAALEYHLDEGLPVVEADHQGIQQIMMNLIINAADALEGESGRISLSTGSLKADRAYLSKIKTGGKELAEGRYVYFEVKDTGRGMSKETAERLFEPFYTTKPKGRGLGLSVVSGVVFSHGGGIEVESAKGAGTRFRVLLQQPEKTLALKTAAPLAEKEDVWKGKGTVLVVDDEEEVLTMTRLVLEQAGYKVFAASSGEEAIEVFSKHKDRISAVMLDFILPTMKGDEVYKELCRLKEDLKVIFLSGYHEVDVKGLTNGGCTATVLQKPYKLNDMLSKVRGLIGK